MLDRHFLTSFLKVNNASENMSDEEVRGVLAKAGWSSAEVAAAIALLRSGPQNNSGTITAGSLGGQVFNPNMEFSSRQLSSLLGVDVVIDPSRVAYHYSGGGPGPSAVRTAVVRTLSVIAIVVLSLGLALASGIAFLYYMEIGPFRV